MLEKSVLLFHSVVLKLGGVQEFKQQSPNPALVKSDGVSEADIGHLDSTQKSRAPGPLGAGGGRSLSLSDLLCAELLLLWPQ